MKQVFLLVFLCITAGWINAQSVNIEGTVITSDDSSPIIGANVYIKGTSTGTITDANGNFTLKANVGETIVFSFIGYLSQEVVVSESVTQLSISLQPDMVQMDEIVVIGYGTQKKSDLTGSVATVSSEEITRKPAATFEQSLQGLAAGVMVTSNSGTPGGGASVQIRGVGSINNSDPLYVIDGVPVGGMESVNPNDIENISVLKDAAASAIYGARGANGVILITTKKGTKGFHVNFESQFGIQKEWKRLDLLNAKQYAEYVNELNYNAGITLPTVTQDPDNLPYDTDWQEEMFQNAPIQKYNLTVSGASEMISYSLSGGYFNQQGIMLNSGYEKYNVRATTEFRWKMLRIGESITLSSSLRNNEKNDVGGRTQIERMLKQTPLVPVYDTSQLGGYAGPTSDHNQDAVNPVGVANLFKNYTHNKINMVGNVFAEVEIIEGLKYKATYGFSYLDKEKTKYTPEYEMGSYQANSDPVWDSTFITNNFGLIENLLTYDKSFGDHNLSIMAGYSVEMNSYRTQNKVTTYYPATDSTNYTVYRKNLYEANLISYLGRINYSYAGKYLLQANVRRDGSSKFGSKNKWGVFPSYSAGWIVSKEDFLSDNEIISFLKVRGSYGAIGNQNINDYQYEASLNPYMTYVFDGGVIANGTGVSSFPNEIVKWETKKSTNFGGEIGLFNNKINLTAEYYIEKSEDMLISIRMPTTNGTTTNPSKNAGSVKNTGIEISLNYRNYDNEFKYSITGNLTTINNEVTDLGPIDQPLVGISTEIGPVSLTSVGQPIGSFYGFQTDGLYTDASLIDPVFAPDAQVGDIKFVDQRGPNGEAPDGVLNDDDKVFLGSPIPTLIYGFNLSAEYKDFDFSMTLQGVYGNKIFRETQCWTEGMYTNFNASTKVLDRYRQNDLDITTTDENGDPVVTHYPANTNTSVPRAVSGDPNHNANYFSDRQLEDGAYMRIKDISIGYNLSNIINNVNIRVYVMGLNVLTFTKYTGYDPEIGVTNLQDEDNRNSSTNPVNLSRGIDNGYYPQAKAIIGGIQISF